MREDHLEALDAMFPKGWICVYTYPDGQVRMSLFNPDRLELLEEYHQLLASKAAPPEEEKSKKWMICNRCGEEWSNLRPGGVCINCEKELKRQKMKMKNFKMPDVDQKNQAAGDDAT